MLTIGLGELDGLTLPPLLFHGPYLWIAMWGFSFPVGTDTCELVPLLLFLLTYLLSRHLYCQGYEGQLWEFAQVPPQGWVYL